MPSHLGVCSGQRGRMEIEIVTRGVSTHGSQPDRGNNAIYLMNPIVDQLADLHGRLVTDHPNLGRGSIAVTEFRSQSPSLTAIPDESRIHIDRRLTIGETPEEAIAEISALPAVQAGGRRGQAARLQPAILARFRLSRPTRSFRPGRPPRRAPAVVAAISTARRSSDGSRGCTDRSSRPAVAPPPGSSAFRPSVSARR